MASSFSRTIRSLRADRPTRQIVIFLAAAALLAAWMGWLIFARVAVYEATPAARLEVEQASHPVQAPVAGRVKRIDMPLGREVRVGDVLCELDGDAQSLELGQAKARLAAIGPEIIAAQKELAAYEQAVLDQGQGTTATVAEARSRSEEARVAERFAEENLARAKRLRAEGLMSEADFEKAKAELAQKQAITQASEGAINRVGASGRADVSGRRAQKESLAREIAKLEGERLTTSALIDRLDNEVKLRVIHASVDGRLAEVGAFTVGSVVREGDRLAAIVPAGVLRVIAEYPPPRALGRILVGQPARLRLDGFPWAQHGTIPAKVSRVASEVRAGKLRVELEVLPNDFGAPLQHGLPGQLEVEVERTSPLSLVLRAAGKVVEGAPPPPREASGDGAPSAEPP
jgi:membrane fusion protein (multidrug efflux system)